MTAQKIIFAFILILSICPILIECFPNSEPSNRVKRFEWPWEYIGKTLCKTAANCDCGNGQSWAKCVSSPGYKASNCCGEGFVWSCCGREV